MSRDRRGRPLPVWQGCRVVGADEVFVMNWQSADSLDGRYFGPVPAIVRHRQSTAYVDQRGVNMIAQSEPSVFSLFRRAQPRSPINRLACDRDRAE